MEKELVKSYIYVNAVLPQLEEIIAFDPEAQQLTKGWNCKIQMHVPNGPGVHFIFKDGKCEAKLGTVSMPTISLRLSSPAAVVKMFENKGTVIPLIWGLWHPKILGNFMKLTKIMEKYMKPTEEMLKDEKIFAFHVRVQLMAAIFGLKAVGEHDSHVIPILAKTANGAMEIKVMPDGPVAHIILDKGKLTPVKGPANDPMVSMQMRDIKLAFDVLNGNVEFMEELGMCRIKLHGHIGMAENMAVVLERIAKYIEE